ncbi:MAG: hypothetical protein U1D55_01435 [Phycisphaerae bacterium]
MSAASPRLYKSANSRIPLLLAAAAGVFWVERSPAQTFTGLGFLPGGSSSAARGVSADGSVVVGDSGPAFGGVGFRWTLAGGMQGLGTLAGGTYSFAPGVSGDGAVVTGWGDSTDGQRAYRWTIAGMENIGALPGAVQALGSAANADGSVLVGVSGAPNGYRAYRWTRAGGMEDLGVLPGGATPAISFGYGVNADGSVVVGDGYAPNGDVAFRWTRAGGMQNLGTLPGGTFSYGYAVSADGLVVVGDSDSLDGDIAYRWTDAEGMTPLGTLPVPFDYMVSNGVNADGSVIVGATSAFFPDGTGHAWLWTAALGLVDLNTYLPTLGIDLTGWTLIDAGGVSADGQTIVGTGNHNGVEESWIARLSCFTLSAIANATICRSGAAAFSIVATGAGPFTYQWQIQTAPGVWATLGNDPMPLPCGGGAFAFATPINSPDVQIGVHPCAGVNAYQIRCLVTSACGSVASNAATLTICDHSGDLNCDGAVNEADLGILLANWQSGPGGDIDGDGNTNETDLGILLSHWQGSCP